MDIDTVTGVVNPASEGEVKVFNKARDQQESVADSILGGVDESSPRVPEQTGQKLNVAA